MGNWETITFCFGFFKQKLKCRTEFAIHCDNSRVKKDVVYCFEWSSIFKPVLLLSKHSVTCQCIYPTAKGELSSKSIIDEWPHHDTSPLHTIC